MASHRLYRVWSSSGASSNFLRELQHLISKSRYRKRGNLLSPLKGVIIAAQKESIRVPAGADSLFPICLIGELGSIRTTYELFALRKQIRVVRTIRFVSNRLVNPCLRDKALATFGFNMAVHQTASSHSDKGNHGDTEPKKEEEKLNEGRGEK